MAVDAAYSTDGTTNAGASVCERAQRGACKTGAATSGVGQEGGSVRRAMGGNQWTPAEAVKLWASEGPD